MLISPGFLLSEGLPYSPLRESDAVIWLRVGRLYFELWCLADQSTLPLLSNDTVRSEQRDHLVKPHDLFFSIGSLVLWIVF